MMLTEHSISFEYKAMKVHYLYFIIVSCISHYVSASGIHFSDQKER